MKEKDFEKGYKAFLKYKESLKRSKEAQRLSTSHKRTQTIEKKKTGMKNEHSK